MATPDASASVVEDVQNETVELNGYRDGNLEKERKVRFTGRGVHEDDEGNEFYVTAGGRIVVRWMRDERITDYGDFAEFVMDLGDAKDGYVDALEAIAEALGIEYEYVEEID